MAFSTSFASLIIPEHAPPELAARIGDACQAGSASLFATGIEPGFGSDVLPDTLLGIVDRLDRLHVSEIAHYGDYGVEYVFRMWGFGNAPDEPIAIFQGDILVQLWGAVVRATGTDGRAVSRR